MGNLKGPGFLEGLRKSRSPFPSGIVGVEIGSDWLKIIQPENGRNGKVSYQVEFLKLAQIKDGIAEAIQESFRLRKFHRQNVVACIPRHLVTMRMLDLPASDPGEISDMIDLQVGKQTPYAREEIVFAHKVIEKGSSGYARVMLGIVTRSIVCERMDVLAKAGLSVKGIMISSEGVYRWFRGAYPAEAQAKTSRALILLDVDSNYSDFIVIRHGKMVFTRNILVGANHLIQEAGGWREKFSDELRRSLERYQGEEKNVEIAKVFLSGAGPKIEGLEGTVGAALDLSIQSVDSLPELRSGNAAMGPASENASFASMIPLMGIVRDEKEPCMDFIPHENRTQSAMELKTKQLTVMGILLVAIVTALSFLCLAHISAKRAYLAKIKKTISQIAVEAESIDKMRAVIDMVELRQDARGSTLECLREISQVTPKEISLTDIDIDEKKTVVLRGYGFAMSDVFKYVKLLEESAMFEDVTTPYTRVKSDGDAKLSEFEIHCAYQQ